MNSKGSSNEMVERKSKVIWSVPNSRRNPKIISSGYALENDTSWRKTRIQGLILGHYRKARGPYG